MKKLLFILLIPFMFSAFSSAIAADKESAFDRIIRTNTLRCGFIAWPPGFEVDANNGEIKGPTKELFESVIKLTGWKVEFIETSLGNAPLDMQNRKFDVMCADGPWTMTNIKQVDYTTPALYSPILVYIRADETRFSSYSDLDDPSVTFVGIDGDISSDLANLRFSQAKFRSLINLTDPAMMMEEVATKKADAVILDPVTAESYMENNPGKMKAFPLHDPLAVYPIGMSVNWGEYKLKQILNRATEMAINIGLVEQKLNLYDPTRRTIHDSTPSYEAPK